MRLERHNIYSLHHPIHLSKTAVSRSSLSTGGGLYVRERRVSTYFLHFLASFFISVLLQLFRPTRPSSVTKDSQKEPKYEPTRACRAAAHLGLTAMALPIDIFGIVWRLNTLDHLRSGLWRARLIGGKLKRGDTDRTSLDLFTRQRRNNE